MCIMFYLHKLYIKFKNKRHKFNEINKNILTQSIKLNCIRCKFISNKSNKSKNFLLLYLTFIISDIKLKIYLKSLIKMSCKCKTSHDTNKTNQVSRKYTN